MGGLTQKGGAAFLTLEDPFLALDAQAARGYGRIARHIADQAFGLVGVQIVQDKGKTNGFGMGLHYAVDQLQKISLVARRPTVGLHLAARHIQTASSERVPWRSYSNSRRTG